MRLFGEQRCPVESLPMISFKGAHCPKDVILFAMFFNVRYGVSYRNLKEIMPERGVSVDHATLNRWVTRNSCAIADAARHRKAPRGRSWRMDETYVWVKGKWVYLYRAIEKQGKTLDFMLSQRRNKAAATKFFARALEVNGLPRKIVIDKSGANTAGIKAINKMLKSSVARSRSKWSGGNISITSLNRITGSSNVGSDPCWDSIPALQPHLSWQA